MSETNHEDEVLDIVEANHEEKLQLLEAIHEYLYNWNFFHLDMLDMLYNLSILSQLDLYIVHLITFDLKKQ